jgi:hypothetical protein
MDHGVVMFQLAQGGEDSIVELPAGSRDGKPPSTASIDPYEAQSSSEVATTGRGAVTATRRPARTAPPDVGTRLSHYRFDARHPSSRASSPLA